MVKNLKGITRDCGKALNLLNTFSQEVGAYGVGSSWEREKKLVLQCDRKKLQIWLEENNLEFNTLRHGELAYETEYFILFSM